jgi:transcriptional regulator with XRE-family HTH domain
MARVRMPADSQSLPLVLQLQDAIRASGLSLHELGRRTGVSEGQLSRFLRGDRTMTLPAAAKVCRYFGLILCPGKHSDPELLGRTNDAHSPSSPSRTRKR